MNEFAEVSGTQLEELLDYLGEVVRRRDDVHTLRFAVDGGVKVKVNEFAWTAPCGRTVWAG